MRLTRNTRKVGRRRVGNGMRMTRSIGRSRNNGVGNLHEIIRIIGKSEGCICRNIVGGRRRRGNSCRLSVVSYRRGAGYGYYGLGTQTGKFAVQKSGESEIVPTEEVIRGYKPLLQGDVVILCGLFVNITVIYKIIESFTIV